MERFLVVSTTTEQSLANRSLSVLEEAGIPVMLEHVEIVAHGRRSSASGYRLLVPVDHVHTAMRIIAATSAKHLTQQTAPGSL